MRGGKFNLPEVHALVEYCHSIDESVRLDVNFSHDAGLRRLGLIALEFTV